MFGSWMAVGWLAACGPEAPTFSGITAITIQEVAGIDGLQRRKLSELELGEAAACLSATKEVPVEASQDAQLLATTYLVEVTDTNGVRSFELFTDKHLKGNKGNYYENRCILGIIQKL